MPPELADDYRKHGEMDTNAGEPGAWMTTGQLIVALRKWREEVDRLKTPAMPDCRQPESDGHAGAAVGRHEVRRRHSPGNGGTEDKMEESHSIDLELIPGHLADSYQQTRRIGTNANGGPCVWMSLGEVRHLFLEWRKEVDRLKAPVQPQQNPEHGDLIGRLHHLWVQFDKARDKVGRVWSEELGKLAAENAELRAEKSRLAVENSSLRARYRSAH